MKCLLELSVFTLMQSCMHNEMILVNISTIGEEFVELLCKINKFCIERLIGNMIAMQVNPQQIALLESFRIEIFQVI
jgi:hypothetical protein